MKHLNEVIEFFRALTPLVLGIVSLAALFAGQWDKAAAFGIWAFYTDYSYKNRMFDKEE